MAVKDITRDASNSFICSLGAIYMNSVEFFRRSAWLDKEISTLKMVLLHSSENVDVISPTGGKGQGKWCQGYFTKWTLLRAPNFGYVTAGCLLNNEHKRLNGKYNISCFLRWWECYKYVRVSRFLILTYAVCYSKPHSSQLQRPFPQFLQRLDLWTAPSYTNQTRPL